MIDDGRKVAMFLKLTFLEGKGRAKLFNSAPPHSGMGKPFTSKVRYEWGF